MMKNRIISCVYLLTALMCAQIDLKASHIENQFQDVNQSKNNNTATVVDDWNRIPDTVIRDHLLPALRVGDYHVMRQVSKYYNQTLKSLLSKDGSWRHAAARHYPAPFVALLQDQSQCRAAVKLMLLSEPRVDFYQFPDAPYTYITAINWNGSVVAGNKRDVNIISPLKLWISTPQTGIQSLPTVTNSSAATSISQITAMNWDGSTMVGTTNDTGQDNLLQQAFVYRHGTGMKLLDLLPGQNQSVAQAVSWDGTVVSGTTTGSRPQAFIYNPEHGMQLLQNYMSPLKEDDTRLAIINKYAVDENRSVASRVKAMNGDGLNIAGEIMGKNNTNNAVFIYNINTDDFNITQPALEANFQMLAMNWNGSKQLCLQIKTNDQNLSIANLFIPLKQGARVLYGPGKGINIEHVVMSQDGQVMILQSKPNFLHNFASDKTLDINKLLTPYLVSSPTHNLDSTCTVNTVNILGNVIAGDIYYGNTNPPTGSTGYSAVMPRYDILKAEGIAHGEPEYLAVDQKISVGDIINYN